MNRLIAFLFTFFFSFIVFAQEVAEDPDAWTYETKRNLLIAFTILCIFFAVRTFRGKPEA